MTQPVSAEAPTSFARQNFDARIHLECVRTLYRQIPNSFVAAMVVTAYIIATMWQKVPREVLLTWLGIQGAAQVHRFWVYRSYRRAAVDVDSAPRWASYYAIYMGVAGVVWGLTPFLFFRIENPIGQALTMCGLYGIAGGSVSGNAYHPPAVYSFVGIIFGAVMLRMLQIGDADHIALGLASLGFAAIMILFCRIQYRSIVDGIRVRFENVELVEQLRKQEAVAVAARLRAEQANLAKSQFLAAASHDLRQPLHALGLFSASLQELRLDTDGQVVVQRINSNIDALESLFDELLDISKLDAGVVTTRPTSVAVQALWDAMRAQFEPLAEERGVRLRFADSRLVLFADSGLTQRILGNLISNAIRYTPRGTVLVGARRRGSGNVRIEVRDQGIGIAEADHQRIFEEFVQVANPERDRRKGLGLGLSIAQRTANLMETRIRVASVPGKGSYFSFDLPRSLLSAVAEIAAPTARLDLVQGKTILLIDDEVTIREGIHTLLTQWGCRAVCVADIESALVALRSAPAPDLILADFRLAAGASGIDAIQVLRQHFRKTIPACLVTGETDPTQLQLAGQSGLTVLHKPVRAAQLRAAMNHLLSAAAEPA